MANDDTRSPVVQQVAKGAVVAGETVVAVANAAAEQVTFSLVSKLQLGLVRQGCREQSANEFHQLCTTAAVATASAAAQQVTPNRQ